VNEDPKSWNGTERRTLDLSPEQIEEIADLAMAKAEEKIQREIGKSVIRFIWYVLGAVLVAVYAYMQAGKSVGH